MKRVLLDTNIYGRIVEKREEGEVKVLIEKRPDILGYGLDVVRKELRDVSKESREKRRLRITLLALYDGITKAHIYLTTAAIRQLACEYYKAYQRLGGTKTEKEIANDFLIVSCASIHEMDVVASENRKTMLSKEARMAYDIVNALRNYRTPVFTNYQQFRRLFS